MFESYSHWGMFDVEELLNGVTATETPWGTLWL